MLSPCHAGRVARVSDQSGATFGSTLLELRTVHAIVISDTIVSMGNARTDLGRVIARRDRKRAIRRRGCDFHALRDRGTRDARETRWQIEREVGSDASTDASTQYSTRPKTFC